MVIGLFVDGADGEYNKNTEDGNIKCIEYSDDRCMEDGPNRYVGDEYRCLLLMTANKKHDRNIYIEV